MIYPDTNKKPKLFLMEARKGVKPGGTDVMPPLFLRQDGKTSPEILKIYHEI